MLVKAESACCLALKFWKSILPMLGIFDFDDKDTLTGEWSCRNLHDLDDQVKIVRKGPVRDDDIALGRGEEGCEDCIPPLEA